MKMLASVLIGVIIAIVVIFGASLYESLVKNRGTYIPWQEVHFSYKDYKGSPSIDDEAFYSIATEKEAVSCLLFYEVYAELSLADLKRLAENDPDAMFDMFVRLTYPDGLYSGANADEALAYLSAAREKGHINAELASFLFPLDEARLLDNIQLIEREYENLTPLATYVKVLLKIAADETYATDLIRLKNAGGYNLLMANGVAAEIAAGYMDKDVLCEAYYNGCVSLYEEKVRYGVSCSE